MKKVILFLVLVLLLYFKSWCQSGTTTFLDIVIDGTKSEMIQKLTKKGFNLDKDNDWLTGKYQDRDVIVIIISNESNKVYQIDVIFNTWVEEIKAKMLFTRLYYYVFEFSTRYEKIEKTSNNPFEAEFLEINDAGIKSKNNIVQLKILKGNLGNTVGIFFINKNNQNDKVN